MIIHFSKEDIIKIVNRHIAGMGYSVEKVDFDCTEYKATVLTVNDKIDSIMRKRYRY